MKCPKCDKGEIKVITMMACSCGHHSLVCIECLTFFDVECGAPYGESKLPPEFPMEVEEQMTALAHKDEHIGPALEELRKEMADYPTLEEFKKTLAASGG